MADYIDFEAIRAAVKTCIGSSLVRVIWDNEPLGMEGFTGLDVAGAVIPGLPNPATDPAASGGAFRVSLSFSVAEQVGVDDMRRAFDSGDNTQKVTQFGIRHSTLTIKVESDFAGPTLTVCERIRNVMVRTSTRDVLRDHGCVIREVGQSRGMSVPNWDGKYVDATILEVFLACGVAELDPIGETGTDAGCQNNWIETVVPLGFTKV